MAAISRKRRKNALRALMRRLPAGDPIANMLGQLGPQVKNIAYDRAAAIVLPTFLEHALKQAIIQHFKPSPTDPEFKYIFDNDHAPYREFASRIRLAKALGVVSESDYEKLEIVRAIRNAFAHTSSAIDFDAQEIDDYCIDLIVPGADPVGPPNRPHAPQNRNRFAMAVLNLYLALQGYKAR
jgi:hypothetical protein